MPYLAKPMWSVTKPDTLAPQLSARALWRSGMGVWGLLVWLLMVGGLVAQSPSTHLTDATPISTPKPPAAVTSTPPQAGESPLGWAEKVLGNMTLDEKIGQLFMAHIFTTPSKQNKAKIVKLIKQHKIGGLIFMQGTPMRQACMINELQALAEVPLMVAQDAEWGLSMRLDSTPRFPYQMTLGALQNDSLIYEMGRLVAQQLRAVGVHVNFAPVVDVNINPQNPVINDRSFGEDKTRVVQKSIQYMRGLQDNGVIASAKHFPGHGDTDVDSHHGLPVIYHSRGRLDSVEFVPFVEMIRAGVKSVMTAHLSIPALDPTPNLPATLSRPIIQGILRDEMGYQGLVFTDALNMAGVARNYPPGVAEVMALEAGNDILLYSENIPLAIDSIKAAIKSGRLTERQIDLIVLKILRAKEWLGLDKHRSVDLGQVRKTLDSPATQVLLDRIYTNAVTLVKASSNSIPLTPNKKRIAYLQVGWMESNTSFYEELRKHGQFDFHAIPDAANLTNHAALFQKLKTYDQVVVAVMGMSRWAHKQYGLTYGTIDFVCELERTGTPTAVAMFGNPYALHHFLEANVLVAGYEGGPAAEIAAVEVLMAIRKPTGQLPISLGGVSAPASHTIAEGTRMNFAQPEDAGLSSQVLGKIEPMIQSYIQQRAMPGCAILVSRGDQIIYHKGFGHTDYDNNRSVDPANHLYDLASITKVAATTLAAMSLYEQGLLNLYAPISHYIPAFANTNKAQTKVIELLQHNSGLPAFVPFWVETVHYGEYRPGIYSSTPKPGFDHQIGQNLYLQSGWPDTVWQRILDVPIKPAAGVVYSDLGMIILCKIIEKITGRSLEQYVTEQFYQPMGLRDLVFLPAQKGLAQRCPPTEVDISFRKQEVQGFVHDPSAALLGGYSGHAGLFGTVYDLTKLMRMLLAGGEYGGRQYLKPETIEFFTSPTLTGSRRGLGWDKPETRAGFSSPTSRYASAKAFGHLGFTGTCVWVDPEFDLVYVLLSNRTYPDPNNKLFTTASIRTRVADLIYEAIEAYEKGQ